MALKSKATEKVREGIPVHLTAPREDLVRINLSVTEMDRLRWKGEALKRRKTLQEMIIDAVNKTIDEEEGAS